MTCDLKLLYFPHFFLVNKRVLQYNVQEALQGTRFFQIFSLPLINLVRGWKRDLLLMNFSLHLFSRTCSVHRVLSRVFLNASAHRHGTCFLKAALPTSAFNRTRDPNFSFSWKEPSIEITFLNFSWPLPDSRPGKQRKKKKEN